MQAVTQCDTGWMRQHMRDCCNVSIRVNAAADWRWYGGAVRRLRNHFCVSGELKRKEDISGGAADWNSARTMQLQGMTRCTAWSVCRRRGWGGSMSRRGSRPLRSTALRSGGRVWAAVGRCSPERGHRCWHLVCVSRGGSTANVGGIFLFFR